MFWKKKGIDYSSLEFRAIEVGTAMIEQTAKRYYPPTTKASVFDVILQTESITTFTVRPEFLLTDCASTVYRDIVTALRATVDGSYTGWKLNLSDWARMKFGGVRYIDQDGILTSGGRTGRVGSRLDRARVGIEPPPVTSRMIWDDEQEPTTTHVGFEEVPTDDRHPACAVELLPVDFLADPSILFSDLFSGTGTGFTGIDDQGIVEAGTTY